MHNLPSVKTLETLTGDRDAAKLIRAVLEIRTRTQLETMLETGKFPVTFEWYRMCYHPMDFQTAKLSMCSEHIGRGHGVEYIERGRGNKSPAIEYVNTGDSYNVTLMAVRGSYRVGCWGDIVERGNYA